MSKYRHIPAVGQINDMACWAASLKWWYKAAMSINASQKKLWDLYKGRATEQGGMPDADMKFIIGQNGMKLFQFTNASSFTFEYVSNLLMCGPIYTAFTEYGTWKRHVNVIYGMSGDSTWADVYCMEPQDHPAGGGKWAGKHIKRGLTDFNSIGSVWAGIHRANYEDWVSCFGNF